MAGGDIWDFRGSDKAPKSFGTFDFTGVLLREDAWYWKKYKYGKGILQINNYHIYIYIVISNTKIMLYFAKF